MNQNLLSSGIDVVDPALPFDFSRPLAAEASLRKAISDEATTGDQGHAFELRTQLARALARQGKLAEAENILRTLHKALPQVTEPTPRLRYLLELGRVLTSKRTPFEAKPLFLEAWELASAHGEDFFAADAAQMMAVVESPKQRFAWTMRALEIAQRSSDARVRTWLGSLYLVAGEHFFQLDQRGKALDSFSTALTHFGTSTSSSQAVTARCWIARTLRSLHRAQEAVASLRELLLELKTARVEDGEAYEELAECLLALGREDEARPFFALAHQHLSRREWLTDNEPSRLARLKKLGKVAASHADRS